MGAEMELFGLKFKNPILTASGILGISQKLFRRLEKAGCGGIVTKSIGLKPGAGYKNPTVVELEYGLINAMGLPNPGIDAFISEIEDLKLKIPLIVSIFGRDGKEFSKLAKELEDKCDALELNVSCPHTKILEIGQHSEAVFKVTKTVRDSCEIPILVKLTPNVTDIVKVAKQAEKGGADGITAINTLKALAIDIEAEKPILSNIYGGLSGKCIKPVALRCVYDIYKNVDIPIVGVGGISCFTDVLEFLMCGASLVQVGTFLKDGIEIFEELKSGVERFLKEKNYTYEDLIGRAVKM
ncbi:MAG: dihydroorotate dehydrogenase [Candidatus Methanofastidiosia archaeon]